MRFVPLVVALSLLVPSAAPGQTKAPDALAHYQQALARDPANGFYLYATIQTARRLGVELPAEVFNNAPVDRWRRQLYEMTTGAWAVQESLQLDRLLQNGDVPDTSPSIPVSTIEGVGTPSIPFDKLIAGRTPTVEWLARAAPADWYYAHFPKVSAMRRVAEASDKWGSHLLSSYSITGRDSRVKQRLESQLLLRATPEFDTLYDLVIDEVAVVGSDPFMREGSDVSVIFGVKNATLLAAHLEKNRRDAVASANRVSISQEHYRDWIVDGVANADRSVSSYAAIRGGLAVVSNSLAALRHVADCIDRMTPSMADSPDFKFMRTVTPYAPADEDGFLFLSDEFVRRVVGPTLKIGEARRLRCATSLQSIGYSALMFRTENGRPPATVDELVESKYLDKTELRCPDGGRYSLDGDVAVCSIHRRLGTLTPNLELQVDKVTKDEADAYAAFREGYKNYWRRYIDPVGIRIQARNGLDIRANILPVVENSPYSQMTDLLGTQPVSLSRPQLKSAVATIDLKLPKGPTTDETKRETKSIFGIDADLLFGKALGDNVSIQVADGSPLFSTDLGGVVDAGGFGPLDEWLFFTPLIAALTLPTAVVAAVQDRSALEKALDQLRSMVRREGKRPSDWFQISDYQVVQGGARTLETITVQFLFLKWRVFYAVAGDRLIIATAPELIEELAAAPKSGDERAAMRIELAPSRWVRIAPSMAMSYAEDARETCLKNLSWIEVLRDGFGKEPYDLESQSLALFGSAFQCPDGGRYQTAGPSRVACSVHGTSDSPRQGPRPQSGSAAAYIVDSVGRIEATLAFTPDGLSTHIVVEPSEPGKAGIKP